eukprot:2589185-Prymnesium_polylepis.2
MSLQGCTLIKSSRVWCTCHVQPLSMTTSSHRVTVREERHGTLSAMSRVLSLGARRLELLKANPARRGGVGVERGTTVIKGPA